MFIIFSNACFLSISLTAIALRNRAGERFFLERQQAMCSSTWGPHGERDLNSKEKPFIWKWITVKQLRSCLLTFVLTASTTSMYCSPSPNTMLISNQYNNAFMAHASESSTPGLVSTCNENDKPVLNLSPRTVSLPSGLEYYDAKEGEANGKIVEEGKTVQFQWTFRRSNGYFVDSSANYNNEPYSYKVGNIGTKKVIAGIDEGIRGMRVGGIRRMSIPANLAYIKGVEDGSPGPIPADFGPKRQILSNPKDLWYFEIKLVKVK